jgi:hypothetical protein
VSEEHEVVLFQIRVAEGWIYESKKDVAHPRFQFAGYFMAFNAIYWLWGMLHGLPHNEVARIQALMERLGAEAASDILSKQAAYIQFLIDRGPIQRMDRRSRTSAAGHTGDGSRYLALLREQAATTRLKGLASILYLIRCNLVHGSKVPQDDLPLRSVPALRSIAEAGLHYTRRHVPR